MFYQGDVISKPEEKEKFLVLSNNWVNKNLRQVTVIPLNEITEKPQDNRRTHLVAHGQDGAYYLAHCEDIQHFVDASLEYDIVDRCTDYNRVSKRVGWIIGGKGVDEEGNIISQEKSTQENPNA